MPPIWVPDERLGGRESVIDPPYDRDAPWNRGVAGGQVLPLINDDAPVIRMRAGAGSGKTFGLRRRVLRILHPQGLGVAPERVLVCAFNRVIARDLERELLAEIAEHPNLGLSLPIVKTIHALCGTLMGTEPRLMLPHEVQLMVADVREEDPTLRTRYTQRGADRALREHEAGFADHSALMQASRAWLALHDAGLIGDLPRNAERALHAGDLHGRYDHVLVDEFQDLTDLEARVVIGLRDEGASFVALGDAKQRIYSFRGAAHALSDLEAFIDGPIEDTSMTECRRCPERVVRLGNEVMRRENEPLDPITEGGVIHVVHWNTPKSEAEGMAAAIANSYRAYTDKRHLVLTTRRQWGYDLRNALRNVDATVPVQTLFAEDALQTWPAREAFMFLCLIADPDAVTIRDWIAYKTPLPDGTDFNGTRRNAGAYLELRRASGVPTLEQALKLAALPAASLHGDGRRDLSMRFRRLAELWGARQLDDRPESVIDEVLEPGRWITISGDRAEHAREDIERMRAECLKILTDRPGSSLRDVVRQLRFRIATREPLGTRDEGGIRIVTLWGAKGLTSEFVYVTGLCDEALPGPHDLEESALDAADHLDEQRRLLYVSVTRAREVMVLSRATKIKNGDIDPLGLSRGRASGPWHSQLTQTRFFRDIALDALPRSVPGERWPGVTGG